MTIYEDLEPRKQAVVAYIKVICQVTEKTTLGVVSGIPLTTTRVKKPSGDEWAELRRLCTFLHVNQDNLQALLKSQIISGNGQGAIKVVNGTQGKKFNAWGHLLVSPIVVPIAVVVTILSAPARFIKWIVRNS